MKKIIYLFSLVFILASCGNKNEPEPKTPVILDPLTTIDIKPAKDGWNKTYPHAPMRVGITPTHLTALEIVEQTTALQFYNPNVMDGVDRWERGFDEKQRDSNPDDPKLMMWATDVISEKGELVPDFIEGNYFILLKFDLTISGAPRDTLGYIPNSVVRAAETAIKKAYNEGDIDAIYKLFNEAFTFLPITGAEYKILKEEGKN